MGAGHDGAAHELRDRLVAQGHTVRVIDFLECCPFGIGWFIKWTYLIQLRVAPWSYDLTYRLWYKLPSTWGVIVRLDTFIAGRRMRKAIADSDADVVVSTYPLSSLVLGNMRKKRWLKVPVMTFLTDFAVHPLWVHPHVDVHLATSDLAAATARERGGDDTRAPGPLVGERFRSPTVDGRQQTRGELGLGEADRAVLVVAGSWGVGDVVGTVDAILAGGGFHAVVVCGRDDQLRNRLQGLPHTTVLGWTDDMPTLMGACDVMVENAGGLTANEAFAVGLPVVTFLPIAGHGKDNAEGMAQLGVTQYARDREHLREALTMLTRPGPERSAQVARAHAMFAADPAEDVVSVAGRREAREIARPIQMPKVRQRARITVVGVLAGYGVMTLGAQGIAAMGVGVAEAPRAADGRVYLGVRLTAREVESPRIQAALGRLDATAIIDAGTARDTGKAPMVSLMDHQIDVGNGGWGAGRPFRYLRARADVAQATEYIRGLAPVEVKEFVPGRRFDAFDQIFARRQGQRLVEPDHVLHHGDRPHHVADRSIYVVDGRGQSVRQLEAALVAFESAADRGQLRVSPLSELR